MSKINAKSHFFRNSTVTETYSSQVPSQGSSPPTSSAGNAAFKRTLSLQTLCICADVAGSQGEGEAEAGAAAHGREDRTLRDAV